MIGSSPKSKPADHVFKRNRPAHHAVVGWWWADPLSGAVIVYYALKEGIARWREGGAVSL